MLTHTLTTCSAIAERALQGALVLVKSGRLELRDNILRTYKSVFNHGDIIGLQSYRIWWKKRKIRVSTPFKVIEVGTNQKPVCNFLSDTLSRTVSELPRLIVQILDTAFLSPPWGLRDNVRCSSLAHWKARSGLLISVNWTFFARCYGWVAIRAKRDRKSAISRKRVVVPECPVCYRVVAINSTW